MGNQIKKKIIFTQVHFQAPQHCNSAYEAFSEDVSAVQTYFT